MGTGQIYTRNQIAKLGNTLIFLCERMGSKMEPLTKTHLLKLVFIIEELSVKKFGIPFFDLKFEAWHLGPVSQDLFVELSGDLNLLEEYIAKGSANSNPEVIAKKQFSDDEFNDLEIELLEEVSARFLYCTAEELVNYTHRINSPWYQTSLKHGLLPHFENKTMTTSQVEIKLEELLCDDERKLNLFNSHREFLKQSRILKSENCLRLAN